MTAMALVIPGDHPCLADHFPGRPLVPAVVLLEAVVVRAATAGYNASGVRSARFLRPLAPNRRCALAFTPRDGQLLRFTLTTDNGEAIARGELECV